MWFNKKYCAPPMPEAKQIDYKAMCDVLKSKVAELQETIDEVQRETREADFVFDFNATAAFSVERNWHNGQPCTIIGYILNTPYTDSQGSVHQNQEVKEWYLYCSATQHAKLAEQFKKSMEK